MQKLSTAPFRAAKKTERKVRKGKGKETRPGSCKNPLRPQARAKVGGDVLLCTGEAAAKRSLECCAPQRKSNENLVVNPLRRARRSRPTTGASRYRLAGAAADELIDILGGNKGNDRGTWAYYCYHHDIGIILDKAYEIASRFRQGEIKNPVTAFQRWLQRSYGREAV